MVRSPCCEKMGLKKGPWTPEEDQILVSYIHKNGHANWRALPKQAGLLRCGKSCRLRWINYLRPDIKRGNFTREEEETIIKMHEMLGNRWSAIAAKLPGRTDNEIKNVWHTNLKKRLLEKPSPSDSVSKRVSQHKMKRTHSNSSTITQSEASSFNVSEMESTNSACTTSSSDFSSVTVGESKNMDMNMNIIKWEDTESLEATVPEIDESFWSEAAIMEENNTTTNMPLLHQYPFESYGLSSNHYEDGMDFWYDLFIRSGDSTELPEF